MAENNIKKLPLKNILEQAFYSLRDDVKMNGLFILIAYVIGAAAVGSWKSLLFWPILFIAYVLWGGSFRYYLKRRPLFDYRALFNSLIPSTKIVVSSLLIVTILILLPLLPLFLNLSPELNLEYTKFLQGDFEHSNWLILIADIVFLFVSPIVVYRPFLAWISALAGRSGSLRFALERTKGNYWEFILLAIITNFSVILARVAILQLGGNDYITMLLVAPLLVYFNIVFVKAYEFFFLNIDD